MNVACLSIRQPWCYFITRLPDPFRKTVENRTWRTHHRGPLVVHAAKGCSRRDFDAACAFAVSSAGVPAALLPTYDALDRGGIVGAAILRDVIEPACGGLRWHIPDHFGFELAQPFALPFRRLAGALGLFRVTLTPTEETMLKKAGVL